MSETTAEQGSALSSGAESDEGDGAGAMRPRRASAPLVPRFQHQGYQGEQVADRRRWVEERTGAELDHVGKFSLDPQSLRGNIENPIGAAQVPLGVAGPLLMQGEHAQGTFYVPLATTEGALLRSYERGMVALTRSGGATARIHLDRNRVSPIFHFADVGEAHDFARRLPEHLPAITAAAEATTQHGKLLSVTCLPAGRRVIVDFEYATGDAHGMNMIVRATDAACRTILERVGGERYLVFSGYSAEKRPAGSLLRGGKGKKVVAGALLPRRVVRAVLRTTSEAMAELWHDTVAGHLTSGSLGYNGQYANGLTALFIACGQDVANVVNSAVGLTQLELTGDGDLYASVTLPSLTVATVGGGTGLGTARECLEMLGCAGGGGAPKLAEITAATVLAGELSMAAAIASGQFVDAHETYGRNRPEGA
ncbi:MAG: hydroxymethylglutaryl-CoA reductase [Acidobacteriota bacterium]|nr:hydroxymethylglutaryl-CoA reductase [Acidobacteriota bacterium]